MVKLINDDYDKYYNELVEQLKKDIDEINIYYAFNKQKNQLLKNHEATGNGLLEKLKNTINDTIDLYIEKARLKYKFDAINKQPDVYNAIQNQQQKFASAQVFNDALNNKLDLQKQTKKLQIENLMMIKTSNILNDQEPYKNDDNKQRLKK